MLVSEIAKEFNTTTKAVLDKLKALRLKAKDGSQDLNKAVVTVLRSELLKELKHQTASKAAVRAASARGVAVESRPKAVAVEDESKPVKEAPKKESPAPEPAPEPAKGKKVAKKSSAPEPPPAETVEPPPVAEKKIAAGKTPIPVVEPKPIPVAPAVAVEQPFVPLKPLLKKKRKPMGREDARTHATVSPGGSAEGKSADGQTPAALETAPEHAAPLKEIELKVPITVKDFAFRIQEKTGVVLKKLMEMGIFANINQNLGEDLTKNLASAFGYSLAKIRTQEQQLVEIHKAEEENPELLTARAPVVTFMGHVDHGKTSLLDRIRKSRVAESEHGGITQHIGAYSVKLPKGRITFLDTPGHEAFTSMRARGAHITDLVVLVVAADEGIMPQTEEAIAHARAANVPIVVALNKIDKRTADPDRVKKQLMEHDLTPEDWGGKTIVSGVSAVTGDGIDQMLEMILLEAELLELRANSQKRASGIVIEAHMSRGKGAIASLIVQSGTLRVNDVIVVGQYYGRVKALFDDFERPITEGGPSMPVEILGLPGVPEAGEMFYAVADEKQAREITEVRVEQLKNERLKGMSKITLEDLYSQIKEGKVRELNVILRADVQGSVEAIKDSLEKLSTTEVKVKFVYTGVGDINSSDVILAVASNAIIMAFQVGVSPKAAEELEKHPVDVREYRIIYDAVSDVKKALEGLLEPKKRKKFLARVEIREVFKLTRGIVAGCFVLKGKILRKAMVDEMRDGQAVHTGTISSLKRFKDDVREVQEGYECGITIEGFDKIQAGDILEAFEIETIARTL